MNAARGITVLFFTVLMAAVIFALLVPMEGLPLDKRWLWLAAVALCLLLFMQMIDEKEHFLLLVLVGLLPFAIGFLFSPVISEDLVWAFDAVLFILYGMWFFKTDLFQKAHFIHDKPVLFAAAFVIWCIPSIFFAVSQKASAFGWFFEIKAFLLFYYVLNRVRSRRHLLHVVEVLLIGLAFEGLVGTLQRTMGHSVGLHFLGENYWPMWWKLARVNGTLGYHTMFGGYLILLIPLCISSLITTRSMLKRAWTFIVLGLSGFSLLFTLSRAAWVGFSVYLLSLPILLYKNGRLRGKSLFRFIVILAGFLLVIVVAWSLISLRVETAGRGEHRILMMKISLSIILKHALTGVGLYNYEYHSYPVFNFWQPVHNEYLRLAAETGIPGFLFFFGFIFLVMREAFRSLRIRDRQLSAVALGVLGSYVAFFTVILFGPEYQNYREKCILWLLAGLVLVLRRIHRDEFFRRQAVQRQMQQPRPG
ncbi:O-antigen ligase family protein [bacterium]|nr:O-antigen ligase family protein [bacterium]